MMTSSLASKLGAGLGMGGGSGSGDGKASPATLMNGSGNGSSNMPAQPPESQQSRTMQIASTFLSGVMAISASQWIGAPFKYMDPEFYKNYMAYTKESFAVLMTTMTQWWSPTVVRVSCDASMRGQLKQLKDGTLQTNFPSRLVLMANHQLYTDWLYLWWIAYTNRMHGRIYIIMKESLKKIPIFGWGAQFYNFIFLSRHWEHDKPRLSRHLDGLKKVTEPMWLLIFPEGTNLASGTREVSRKWAKKNGVADMKHQLLPRSTGLRFLLQELGDTTEWLYDCTIAYEGVPPGQFGQDIFTLSSSFLEGKPPKSVNMHWRRFKVADIPLENAKEFEIWLRNRWREKDYMLEHWSRTKRFPADEQWILKEGSLASGKSGSQRMAPYIETQVKSRNWEEFLSIFEPITAVFVGLSLLNGQNGRKGKGSDPKTQQEQLSFIKALMSQHAPIKTDGGGTPHFAPPDNLQKQISSTYPALAGTLKIPSPRPPASSISSGTRGPAYSMLGSSVRGGSSSIRTAPTTVSSTRATSIVPPSTIASTVPPASTIASALPPPPIQPPAAASTSVTQSTTKKRKPAKLNRQNTNTTTPSVAGNKPPSSAGINLKADDLPLGASAASLNGMLSRRPSVSSGVRPQLPKPSKPTQPATSAQAAAQAQKCGIKPKSVTPADTKSRKGSIAPGKPDAIPVIEVKKSVKFADGRVAETTVLKEPRASGAIVCIAPGILKKLKEEGELQKVAPLTTTTTSGNKKAPKLASQGKEVTSEAPLLNISPDVLARLKAGQGVASLANGTATANGSVGGKKKPPKLEKRVSDTKKAGPPKLISTDPATLARLRAKTAAANGAAK